MKKKVILASILKPVNDIRLFEKIGKTILRNFNVEIHSIGYKAMNERIEKDCFFYPIYSFKRLSCKRIFAPFFYLKLIYQIKPTLIIIGTHELLFPSVFYKLFHWQTKLIYDIQENYFYNIIYTNSFPSYIRNFIAYWVKLTEYLNAHFITTFYLAEQTYHSELSWLDNSKKMILENKSMNGLITRKTNSILHIVYSGTISETYGVEDAIIFCKKVSQHFEVKLSIIGFCPNEMYRSKLHSICKKHKFITLITNEFPIPHSEIINQLATADWAILPYQKNKSTENRIPTKLYECIVLEVPILISYNTTWDNLRNKYDFGLSIKNWNLINDSLIQSLLSKNWYKNKNTKECYWDENALIENIKKNKSLPTI